MSVRPRWIALSVVAALVGLFLILPTLYVIPMSFNASPTLGVADGHWTLAWYRELFTAPAWRTSALNSLKIGTGSALLATALGTAAAWGLLKSGRLRSILQGLTLSPLIVPAVIVGIGTYMVFLRWNLTGTLTGLVLAHTVLATPLVVVAVSASLAQLDPTYELAAASLGAGPWRRFCRIVLPLIAPGVVAGALFAFITSWDEIVVSVFLTDPTTRTLPVLMWTQVRTQVSPTLAALGTLLVALSSLALIAMQLLRKEDNR